MAAQRRDMGPMLKFPGRGIKPITDLSGTTFVRLTVLWPIGYGRHWHVYWLCVCACGVFTELDTCRLVSGKTKSCGCLERENRLTVNRTHGHASRATGMSPELRSFFHAKARCQNPKDAKFPSYGGRGIEFRFSSFAQFYAEVGARPKGMSIERINNDGHYEVGNVKWATAKEQRANQRPIAHRRNRAA
jgi:hypothetical protein